MANLNDGFKIIGTNLNSATSQTSINDNGVIAYIGTTGDGTSIFATTGDGGTPKNLMTNVIKATFNNNIYALRNPTRWFDFAFDDKFTIEFGPGIQINNNNEVVVRRIERVNGPATISNVLTIREDGLPIGFSAFGGFLIGGEVATVLPQVPFVDKAYTFIEKWDANSVDKVEPAIHGFPAVVLFIGDPLTTFIAIPQPFEGDIDLVRGYPTLNNNGNIVFTGAEVGGDDEGEYIGFIDSSKEGTKRPYGAREDIGQPRIADDDTTVFWFRDSITVRNTSFDTVRSIASGNVGKNPGISDDGSVVAFYGDLGSQGKGIFANIDGENILVAGIGTTRNGNGTLEAGETWLNGVDVDLMSGFDVDSPIGVAKGDSGIRLAYIAYDESGKETLFTSTVTLDKVPLEPLAMAKVGDTIWGTTVNDIDIYDPINKFGQIVFSVNDDTVITAGATPSIGIDRWWATVGDEPIEVSLYISVPEKAQYTLDIDIENFAFQKWDLKSGAKIIINGDKSNSISIGNDGTANLGELTPGRHQLKIDGFKVPSQPIVEEVSFALRKGDTEIDKLVTKFVADHPEPKINLSLISQYAPILLFEQGEKYNVPLDPDGYNWDEKLQRQEPNQDEPVRTGDAETIVVLGSLQSSPTIFATLLEQNGETAITYYFHYAKSNWADYDGANTHEGDWEGVTVFLKNGTPDRVAFNQHVEIAGVFGSTYTNEGDGGATYRWEYLDFDEQTGRPKVYVGLGGHASYSKSGETTWFSPNPLDLFGNVESHLGNGVKVSPNVKYLPRVGDGYIGDAISTEDGKAQEWLLFSGKWGEQNKRVSFLGGGDDGMEGPVFQKLESLSVDIGSSNRGERWLDPWAFTNAFDVPLIAQDDSLIVNNQQTTFTFDKKDLLKNDNYNEERDILVIPNPVSMLSGKVSINGSQITYELPTAIDTNAESITDSFDYVLLDSTLEKEFMDAAIDILKIQLTVLNPKATLLDKVDAYLTLVKLLANPPAILSNSLGEEVDLTGTVNVKIERTKLSIAPTNANQTEGDSSTKAFTFTVTRDTTSGSNLVNWAVTGTGNNPVDATDFGGVLPSGTISFIEGETSRNITVEVSGDETVESDENFAVTLSNPSQGAIITTAIATGTIFNDDAALSINDVSITEGNSGTTNAIFTVTRTGDITEASTVNYSTANGTSTSTDYTTTNGTLTFGINEAEKTITVPVIGDTSFEENETFFVKLSNPTNAVIIDDQGVGTIINDDIATELEDKVEVESSGNTKLVKNSAKYYFAKSGNNTPIPIILPNDFSFLGGAITSNTKVQLYEGMSPTWNAIAAETVNGKNRVLLKNTGTKALSVLPFDSNWEWVLDLSESLWAWDSPAALNQENNFGVDANGDGAIGVPVTVASSVTLAVTPNSVTEDGTPNLIYTFTRTGSTTNALTVNYSIAGTADATDYTGATPGTGKTITFTAGLPTATLTINPTADTTVENNETVALTLATGTGYTVGTTTPITATITNDDVASYGSKLTTPIIRFQNTDKPGTYLFAGEQEAASIRQNYKGFKEEGLAFQVAVNEDDPLMQPFYRFQNTTKGREGTYLFADEKEAISIRQNYKNFKEEGLAFYAYSAGVGGGTTDFARFQNKNAPGTYLFTGPSETSSVLKNFPGFTLEGSAFAAG